MIKENKLTLIITSVIILMPVAAGILFWDSLPTDMATHFNMKNEVDGYMSRVAVVFGMPLFMLAIQWICAVVTAKDPKKQNINAKLYRLVLWIIPTVSLFAFSFMYAYNLGIKLNTSYFATLFTGILFAVIGNFFPKIRQNYTIGIKLPWTLANEENWNKTHRLAGFLWIISGLLMIAAALLGVSNSRAIGIVAVIIVAIPGVYSFYLHNSKGL